MFYVRRGGSLIDLHTLKHAKIRSFFVFRHIFLVSPNPMEYAGKDWTCTTSRLILAPPSIPWSPSTHLGLGGAVTM